jgi:hypothetical protein
MIGGNVLLSHHDSSMTSERTFTVEFGAVHLLLVKSKVLLVLLRARLPTTLGWVTASDSRFRPLDINTVQMKCVNKIFLNVKLM